VPLTDRLPALGHRHFRNFVIGSFVSNVGGTIQFWAVAWHVYYLTESSFMVGLVAGIRVVPLLIFSMVGGAIADTHDRRNILLLTQSVMALVSLVIAAATFSGMATVGVLIALVTVNVIPAAFNGPARQSLIVTLVPREHFPNAASVNGMQWRLSDILGPAIAGIMIGLSIGPEKGLSLCYALNAVSFLAAIYVTWLLPKTPLPPERDRMTMPRMLRMIREGVQFVFRKPILRDTMTLDFFATLLSGAEALLPAFAVMLGLGPEGYGLLASSAGIGALTAAGIIAWLPPIRYQGRLVLAMILCYGLFTIGFGLSPNAPMAMVFLALTGAADMASTVMRQTIRQLNTPDEVRGRMNATSMVFNITGPRLGDLESGFVAKLIGERLAVVSGGIGCIVIWAIYSWRAKELKSYEHESATQ
jgi:MFS family permease